MEGKRIDRKQLAYLMSLKPQEAAQKIAYVHCKVNGILISNSNILKDDYKFYSEGSQKIEDCEKYLNFPISMFINTLIKNSSKPGQLRSMLLNHQPSIEKGEPVGWVAVHCSLLDKEVVNDLKSVWHKKKRAQTDSENDLFK